MGLEDLAKLRLLQNIVSVFLRSERAKTNKKMGFQENSCFIIITKSRAGHFQQDIEKWKKYN